jgi:hypothetical protein
LDGVTTVCAASGVTAASEKAASKTRRMKNSKKKKWIGYYSTRRAESARDWSLCQRGLCFFSLEIKECPSF